MVTFAFANRVKRNFRYFQFVHGNSLKMTTSLSTTEPAKRVTTLVDASFLKYPGFRAKFHWDELWNMRTE